MTLIKHKQKMVLKHYLIYKKKTITNLLKLCKNNFMFSENPNADRYI